MRRLTLLIAAGSLWLFLAAVPALADGGPHVASDNSGVTSLTADSCAGCHRAHTAQGAMLLKTDEEDLCLSCHGAASVGATTDVESGIQYALATNGLRDDTAVLGALRGGGFEATRIGDPFRYQVGTSRFSKVQVADAASPVTSAHLDLGGTLGQLGIAWGNGANGDGPGPVASITCGSCHNVHGNGQYRILQVLPEGDGIDDAWVIDVYDYGVIAADTYRTVSSHGLLNDDVVTVAGMTGSGNVANATVTVVSDTRFTLSGVTGGTGTGGTVTRNGGVVVTDGPDVPAGDARNYTVIQTLASAPTLLASEAAAYDPTDGDYWHYRIPWNGSGTLGTTYNYDAPNGIPGTPAADGRSVVTGFRSFSQEITAWCTSCHTRYWAWSNPTEATGDEPATGGAYANARPGDDVFTYQHRTRGSSNRGCLTCHVSHGTSAVMDGAYSSTFTFPDGTASDNSRLLKVDNRGTCQLCHDPTGTGQAGDQYPPAPYPIPGTP